MEFVLGRIQLSFQMKMGRMLCFLVKFPKGKLLNEKFYDQRID